MCVRVCARVCVCVQVGLTNIVFIFWLLDAMLLFLCFFASFSFNFFFVLQFFSARGHFIWLTVIIICFVRWQCASVCVCVCACPDYCYLHTCVPAYKRKLLTCHLRPSVLPVPAKHPLNILFFPSHPSWAIWLILLLFNWKYARRFTWIIYICIQYWMSKCVRTSAKWHLTYIE